MAIQLFFRVSIVVFFSIATVSAQSGDLAATGRVVSSGGAGIANATITYTGLAKRLSWDFSDANGYFGIRTPTSARPSASSVNIRTSSTSPAAIDVFDLRGRRVASTLRVRIDKGSYSIEPQAGMHAGSLYLIRIAAGNSMIFRKLIAAGSKKVFVQAHESELSGSGKPLSKELAVVDTLRVGKTGYTPVKIPIDSFAADVGPVTLSPINIESQVTTMLSSLSQAERVGQLCEINYPGATYARDNLMGVVFGGGSSGPNGASATASEWATFLDGYQTAVTGTGGTAKKIPLLTGLDIVHGIGKCTGATILPHNIGLGCTWDPKIVQKCHRVAAIESRACGVNFAFGPCIAVPRDKRWGRVYEGFAETPELTTAMATAAVLGFQTTDLSYPLAVAACIKHFAADGGTIFGTGQSGLVDRGDAQGTDATLRAIHLPGYTSAIQAQAAAVMASFSAWNGVRMHENKVLLTDWLKTSQGFDGIINGDWKGHVTGTTGATAIAQTQNCMTAGLDVPMGTATADLATLTGAFNGMYSAGGRIDDAVKRILRIKYRMGLFSNPVTTNAALTALVGSSAHRDIAREAVRKSLVCLKNTGGVLPIAKTAKVTMVGQHSQDIGLQCGGWTMSWQGSAGNITAGTTIRQGFESIGGTANITYSADGTSIPGDIAVVCIGEQPYAEYVGDRTSLAVPNANYVTNAHNSGKKVVCILISGRPMEISSIIASCDAFVCAWLPGSEGGGVAEVLYGNYDFTGKLSMTMPASSSQYTLNNGDANYTPLFKYGFGLNLAGQQLPSGLYQ